MYEIHAEGNIKEEVLNIVTENRKIAYGAALWNISEKIGPKELRNFLTCDIEEMEDPNFQFNMWKRWHQFVLRKPSDITQLFKWSDKMLEKCLDAGNAIMLFKNNDNAKWLIYHIYDM